MSLRQRFILILCLAIIAVSAALFAIVQLEAQSHEARERIALEKSDSLIRLLSSWALTHPTDMTTLRSQTESPVAKKVISTLIANLPDTSLGYCDARGTILITATHAVYLPPGSSASSYELHPPGVMPLDFSGGLLPADRDTVSRACSNSSISEIHRTRATLPRDLLLVSTQAVDSTVSAFVLVRLAPPHPSGAGWIWPMNIGIIGLASILLVYLGIDAMVALRQGAKTLADGLEKLKVDLGANFPNPRTAELSEVADGIRDMASHLARAREQRIALERELSHRQRLSGLGRVVAGVAHEVRTPLTGIKLKLDSMARRKLDDRSTRDISVCLEEIARLDRVVSSLLLVSKKSKSEKKVIDLGGFVDNKIEHLREMAEEKRITLSRCGAAYASGNLEDLSRILDNLIRNAIEASPPDELIQISLSISELNGSPATKISVSDRGAGIPEDRVGELFEPFFTLKPQGTGLGLFMSRALVEAQSGRLLYERTYDLTSFSIYLPLDPANGEDTSSSGR